MFIIKKSRCILCGIAKFKHAHCCKVWYMKRLQTICRSVSAIRVLALSEDNSKPKHRSLTPVHKPLTITNTFILCEVLFWLYMVDLMFSYLLFISLALRLSLVYLRGQSITKFTLENRGARQNVMLCIKGWAGVQASFA